MMNQTQFNKSSKKVIYPLFGFLFIIYVFDVSDRMGWINLAKAQDVTSQSTQDLVNALNTLDSSMVVVNSAVKDTKSKLFIYSKDQTDTINWWGNCAKDVACWEWLKPQPK